MDNLPYSRYGLIGLVMTLGLVLGLAAVTMLQTGQMEAAAEEVQHEATERGHEIYADACAACHGEEGEGGGSGLPALNKKEYLTAATDEIIFNVINDGRPGTGMPAWGQDQGGPYNAQAIDDLVAFIRAWEPTAPSQEDQPYIPDLNRGQTLFSNTCFACHGPNGEGTNVAPALNEPEYLAKFDDDYLRATIQRGRPTRGMPTWGSVLAPDQITDLVAYIRSWETGSPGEAELPGGDASRGQNLFAVTCVSCHGINGFGTDLAPQPLSRPEYLRNVTDEQIFDQISQGSTAMPAWNEVLSPAEIGDLVAYIRVLPPPPGPDDLVGDIANGARLYTAGCLACHGPAGQGIAGVGGPLRNVARLATISVEELRTIILEGLLPEAGMPPWQGDLSDQEVADLIALLQSWQRLPTGADVAPETAGPVGDPAAGQAVYAQECALCHGDEAEGDDDFPALRQSASVQAMSDDELANLISAGVANTLMLSFSDRLTGNQLADLVAFIRSLQPGQAQPAPEPADVATETTGSGGNPAAGQIVYDKQCAPCHGAEAEGKDDFPGLRQSASVQAMSNDELRNLIFSGVADTLMRGFANSLTTDEIDDVVAFIWNLQPGGPPPPPAQEVVTTETTGSGGDAAAGQAIFAEQCAPCHGTEAEGTENFPGLSQSQNLPVMTDGDLHDLISSGIAGTLMIPFADRLTDDQIDDVIAFVRRVQAVIGDPVAGQAIFAEQCAPCHGAEGEGTESFPGLRQSANVQAMSQDELHSLISSGIADTLMIAFADRLTDDQIDDVIAFLRNLQAGSLPSEPSEPSEPSGGDTAAGQAIYVEQCAPCHGAEAEGQGNFPALRQSENVQAISDDELGNLIANGVAGTAMIGFADRLTADQLAEIVAFLRALQ